MMRGFERGRGFSMDRLFAAPPETVFDCWTRPELLGWFFNPDNATEVPVTVDLRIGGQWRQHMVINADTAYMTGGVYREIERPRRLAFTFGAVDGWPKIALDDLDASPLVTLDFSTHLQGSLMRLSMLFPDDYADTEVDKWLAVGVEKGWGATIDRLVARYPVRDGSA